MTVVHSSWYEPYHTENTKAQMHKEAGDNTVSKDTHRSANSQVASYTHMHMRTQFKSLQRYMLRKAVEEGEAKCGRRTTTLAVQTPKGFWDITLQDRLFGSWLQFLLLRVLILLLDFLPNVRRMKT